MGKLSDLFKTVVSDMKESLHEIAESAKQECVVCGAQSKFHSFLETKDHKAICSKCSDFLSEKLCEKIEDMNYVDVEPYFEYLHYSRKYLEPVFQGLMRYEELRVDRVNGLIKVGKRILDLRDVQECTLAFTPEKQFYKADEWIGGEVNITVHLDNGLEFKDVACYYTSTPPLEGESYGTVRYEDPEDLQKFRQELFDLIRYFRGSYDSGKYMKYLANKNAE